MLKQALFKIKGMQRDISASLFNPEYAYENRNIRFNTTDNVLDSSGLFSMTNEKGVAQQNCNNILMGKQAVPIGSAIIDNKLIVFYATGQDDYIMQYTIDSTENIIEDKATSEILFQGQLSFNRDYPIETLVSYENEQVQKIYWTDNLNPPRVINIAGDRSNWNENSFNWSSKLNLDEVVTITKNVNSSGLFSAGTIQYAFTYFNYFGQESNIFYSSPLYYTSHSTRGGKEDETINNSFTIRINNVDTKFEYVRIYSIFRSSYNGTPVVKKIVDISTKDLSVVNVHDRDVLFQEMNYLTNDIKLVKHDNTEETLNSNIQDGYSGSIYKRVINYSTNEFFDIPQNATIISNAGYPPTGDAQVILYEGTETNRLYISIYKFEEGIQYTDNNTQGSIVDSQELLYKGGEDIIFSTFIQKDNTLFIGDYTLNKRVLDADIIRNYIFENNNNIDWVSKEITISDPDGVFYPYNSIDNQLNLSSYQSKVFKANETYRLGIQCQYENGNWSEPIGIGDYKNTSYPETSYTGKIKVEGEYVEAHYIRSSIPQISLSNTLIDYLENKGVVAVRPIIVYPNLNNREVICQGVLNPTVYNMKERYNDRTYAQSSWFFRPNLAYSISSSFDPSDSVQLDRPTIDPNEDIISKGAWLEFRHHHSLPDNTHRNCEIQCNIRGTEINYLETANTGNNITGDMNSLVEANKDLFFVDQSIVTLHSPDLEYNKDLDNFNYDNLKLRIVGIVPFTSFNSDINIDCSSPIKETETLPNLSVGFNKQAVGDFNTSKYGYRSLVSGLFWLDIIDESDLHQPYATPRVIAPAIYPFHRKGNLWSNDLNHKELSNLNSKCICNYKYSYNSAYFSSDVKQLKGVTYFDNIICNIHLKDSNQIIRLKNKNYLGNIDTVVESANSYRGSIGNITGVSLSSQYNKDIFNLIYTRSSEIPLTQATYADFTDSISMKYKSTNHIVIDLNQKGYEDENYNLISPNSYTPLPCLSIEQMSFGNIEWNNLNYTAIASTFFDASYKSYPAIIRANYNKYTNSLFSGSPTCGWLWLGELYREVNNKFGSIDNIDNTWQVCGKSIKLNSTVNIKWEQGDAYYQRYDCLKTYTEEGVVNGIKEMASFMCETYINLDGRTDRNRGQLNISITPDIIQRNGVYDNKNNYFLYHSVDKHLSNINTFKNRVAQCQTKIPGDSTDNWTNLRIVNDIDFDGNLGAVTSLQRFNNQIIVFQEKGISQLLYNEQAQINTTEGVPIYLANSGIVQGKRYISNIIGCNNKYSITETPNGLYFIDDNTKGIYLFNGQLDNISNKLGMSSWVKHILENISKWNPYTFNNVISYFDPVNKDVLFVTKDDCLAFNEQIGQFTSFYDYSEMLYFSPLKEGTLLFHNIEGNYIQYLYQEGDHCTFFDGYKPYYTTIVVNPDYTKDKIFNNVEFRSDTWKNGELQSDTSFDRLRVWNEYQDTGEVILSSKNTTLGLNHSNLKRKFRIWRANIGRQEQSRDRIRNVWAYLTLKANGDSGDTKTVLNDIVVSYFE